MANTSDVTVQSSVQMLKNVVDNGGDHVMTQIVMDSIAEVI